jgi:hypothetical protein
MGTMDILFLSPGYPAEMPLFVRGLAQVGARVWGVGDQPKEALPEDARKALSGYLPVKSLWDEEATIGAIQNWQGEQMAQTSSHCIAVCSGYRSLPV